MGTVQQEAKTIRELLEQYFPLLVGGGGTVDEATLIALLAALSTNIGIRAPAEPGYWVYIPTTEGDFNTALLVGNFASDAYASEFKSNSVAVSATSQNGFAVEAVSQNGTAVFAQGNGSQPGALIRNYAGGRAILAQVNAGESAIVGENTGSGPGVRGQSTTAAVMAVASGSGAGVDVFAASGPVLRGDAGGVSNSGLRELITLSTRPVFDNSVEAGYGGSIRITAQFSPVLFGTLAQMRAEMLGGPSAGARGALSIWQGAGAVDAIAYDGQDSATQTGLLVRHDGSQVRVKVGPAGSGPGGSGRALYID